MIQAPQVQELIDGGYLVGTKTYAPATPDLTGVHTRHGDYVEGELADRMDRPELVGDVVTHWHRLAKRRKTIVFATSVGHSIHLKEEFLKAGVNAVHIDGTTPKDDRDEILQRFADGEIEVVCNCQVLTEGWDCPSVEVCVLARPTKSLGLFRQMVGRVLRPYPGKEHALIIDHAGATLRHGRVEDHIEWSLDPDTHAKNRDHARRGRELHRDGDGLLTCPKCQAIRLPGKPCPECGHYPQRPGEYLRHLEGDLQELGHRNGKLKPSEWSPAQKQEFHRMLAGIAAEKRWNPGAISWKFKEKFGHWPANRNVAPLEPSPEVRSWVRSRQIAYAKARQGRTNA
jgi:superfamily II DNA or RNA helicase